MRTTIKTIFAIGLMTAMGAPVPMAHAEGDEADGNWLNSRCRAARLAREVQQDQLEGYVKVRYDIQPNGRVTNIRVIESTHDGVMDLSVKNAMRGWRYFAYLKDGVESGRKDVEMKVTFGGDPNVQETSCTHVPWAEATTAAAGK